MGKDMFTSVTELEQWAEDVGKTIQFTYRIRMTPRWLVRIARTGWVQGDPVYVQATSDSLSEAFERALEKYWTDEVDGEGRRGTFSQSQNEDE